MFVVWLSFAIAAPPPSVDLDDIAGWTQAADRMLSGPPGCWEVVGQARWSWNLGRFGSNRGNAVIVGRLRDGVWVDIEAISAGEVSRRGKKPVQHRYVDEVRVVPLLGRVESSRGRGRRAEAPTSPINVVHQALEEITGDVEISWASWEDSTQAVVLHRQVPVGAGRPAPDATVVVRFPGGLSTPDALDVVFPEKWRTKADPVSATVTGASLQVRGQIIDGAVFPRSEAFRGDVSVLGFQFSGGQTIDYRSIVPCEKAPD